MPHGIPSLLPRLRRSVSARPLCALPLVLCPFLAGCASLGLWPPEGSRGPASRACGSAGSDAEVYRSAQRDWIEHLESEIDHLRADLHQAEEAMAAIESGLRGLHTRADAVSALAEARIAVESAGQNAPWRTEDALEARSKLDEAERQLQAGHAGPAVFFASRARRIADTMNEEASKVAQSPEARFIHASRVNLRSGPSTSHRVIDVLGEATPVFSERREGDWVLVRTPAGSVGWIHASLLRSP